MFLKLLKDSCESSCNETELKETCGCLVAKANKSWWSEEDINRQGFYKEKSTTDCPMKRKEACLK